MEIDVGRILEALPAMVWTALPDGQIDFANRRWSEYTGLRLDEAHRWEWQAVLNPEDLPKLLERWGSILASGEPGEMEARVLRADGQYRSVVFQCSPLSDDPGHIVRWFGVGTDVEEFRRKAGELLHAREESDLGLIINTIPVMAWSARPDGSAEFFNQQYLKYVGLSVGEPRNWDWTAAVSEYWDLTVAVHPDDLNGFAAKWQAILASGQPGEAEARLRRFDGKYRWFLFRVNPLRDGSENIIKWYGTNTDIDDRKEAEEALKRSEAFLAEGQHLARMGTFSWRVATGKILWSEQLRRIFEFRPGVRVTLDLIASRIHPEDMPLMGDMVERAQRGESDFEYRHRIVLPDQSVKHLHLIAHRAGGHPALVEYIGAVLDITQRRLSEEALEKARSDLAQATRIMSLGVLTASIAHEVNQPLSGIVTNAGTCLRMLAANPPNVDGARETARRTIRDGNRAADVIARLRTLFSKRAVTIESVDLNEAVREVIALSWGDLQRSRVVLHTELANGLPYVGGDRVQLQQVIMNLLRNAADAMHGVDDRPRRLLITTGPDEDEHVRLTVQDAGVGFGSQGSERLFQAFYTTKSDGMGIGLSVSRSIIESHGGRLWAEANDGPGASFSFSIPEYSEDTALLHKHDAMQAPATDSARVQRGSHESH